MSLRLFDQNNQPLNAIWKWVITVSIIKQSSGTSSQFFKFCFYIVLENLNSLGKKIKIPLLKSILQGLSNDTTCFFDELWGGGGGRRDIRGKKNEVNDKPKVNKTWLLSSHRRNSKKQVKFFCE